MFHRIFNFLSSLRLTVVLLSLALVLVFVGTMGQEPLGLYMDQERFFRTLFVDAATFWAATKKILQMVKIYLPPSTPADVMNASWFPVFPGGWLLGTLLLMNLVAAHAKRFQFTWKKSGIILTHTGLILLLLGQFFTEIFQIESNLRLREGEARNYTEDFRKNELAIVNHSFSSESNHVVTFPERIIANAGDFQHETLPFTVRVKKYFENSKMTGPKAGAADAVTADHGIGQRIALAPTRTVASMDDENKPAALVEIVADGQVVGSWLASTWFTKYPVELMKDVVGDSLAHDLVQPQKFEVKGKTYEIALRPTRYYKPYTISLVDFRHDKYPGTEIPKNFSSKIHLADPTRGEERDILIYMNNPLRYAGETFFQSGFLPGDKGTILQVVKNPAAITPYVSCTMMGLGMVMQFGMHLTAFRKRKDKELKSVPRAATQPVETLERKAS